MENYAYFTIGLIFVGVSSYISFFRKKRKRWKDERKIDFLK
ncbi:LPXTG cell wall anchor domain-containing protein [Halarcobacter bivalviorum]|nr:LPXTG cell wall anchor domain-containing protein [Halarcobacter bivalviorum]